MKLRSVRGTHDLYGDDIKKYNHIKDVVSNKADLQSFNELQTPKINKMRTSNEVIKRGFIEKIFGGVGTQKVPNTN